MSRTTHLKIKIKTLAAESTLIRLDEKKTLANARKSKALNYDASDLYSAHKSLSDHRTGIVRCTARKNLIAYGYLRGLSISQMESPNSDPSQFPSAEDIVKIARNFHTGTLEERQALEAKILSELKDWQQKLISNQGLLQGKRTAKRSQRRAAQGSLTQEQRELRAENWAARSRCVAEPNPDLVDQYLSKRNPQLTGRPITSRGGV